MGFYCRDCGKDVDEKQSDQTMSDTPNTRAVIQAADGRWTYSIKNFCESMERKLTKLQRERDEAVNNYETAVLREHHMQEQRDRYKIALDKYSEDETTNTLLSLKEQRDRLAIIARELTAMIRVNVMWGRFSECTVEQIDEYLKPWNEKIAAVKGGSHE